GLGRRADLAERGEDRQELGVEDAVRRDQVRAVRGAVVARVRVREVLLLDAARRGEPDLVRAERELLAQVLEQRRVVAAVVLADALRLADAGEDRERGAEVPEV